MKDLIFKMRYFLFFFGVVFAVVYTSVKNPRLEPLDNGNIQKAILIDSLTAKIEDLKHELYVTQTIVDRYEIAISIYKDENPKAMEKLEYILYTQTE